MKEKLGIAAALFLVGSTSACAEAYEPIQVVTLPEELREISGLTTVATGHLLAHNDERGEIYTIDLATGAVTETIQLGKKAVRADFEGITSLGPYTYLTTSTGLIYEVKTAPDQRRTRFNIYDSGLEDICEVEGLATDGQEALLLLCKNSTRKLTIYRWRIEERLAQPTIWIDVPISSFLPTSSSAAAEVRWTGLTRDERNGGYYVLSSREHWLVRLNSQGIPTSSTKLTSSLHPQAEGVAVLPNGSLAIADEGGDGEGKVTVYAPLP